MRDQHSRTQENGGEISSEKLRRGGLYGPIIVDIFATRDEVYGTGVHGDIINSAVNFLPRLFFGKSKNSPSNRSKYKYITGKEVRDGPV